MSIHDLLQWANSALLVFVLAGMVRFHRDWSELRFMVRTLWREREQELSAQAGEYERRGSSDRRHSGSGRDNMGLETH